MNFAGCHKKIDKNDLAEIVDLSADAIISLDGAQKIVLFNAAAEKIFGYHAEEIIGQSLNILLPHSLHKKHNEYIGAYGRSEDVTRPMGLRNDLFGITKSGERVPLDITIQKHSGTGACHFTAICRDISHRLEQEKRIRENEALLLSAQRVAHLGNWQWFIDTNEYYWSEEVYKIYEQDPDIIKPGYEAFIGTIHPDDRPRVEKVVRDALESLNPYRITHRILLPGGREKIVEVRGEVICNEDATPIRMDGIVQDITESWNREQELILAKRQADEANIAKAQFLATVSHELRTPLNAIIGFSAMIAEEQLGKINNPTYQKYAVDVNKSGKDLLGLINDILSVTSYELGSLKFQPSEFSAQSLLDKTMPIIHDKALAKNIHIETTLAQNMPDFYLDPDHMQQIMAHLIDNAIKFSKENDTVKVKLDYIEDEFIIDIIDQGIGLEDEDIKPVFDLFVQKDMNINRLYGGIGLGLAIVKNLVELQGGRVQVKSRPELGSCFSLYFSNEKKDAKYHN